MRRPEGGKIGVIDERWHVLGEEGAAGGAARYVDYSVERMEVKVKRMTGERYAVTCNGYRVPLHSTGTHGEFVAGYATAHGSPRTASTPQSRFTLRWFLIWWIHGTMPQWLAARIMQPTLVVAAMRISP
jgi:hypothetical protein